MVVRVRKRTANRKLRKPIATLSQSSQFLHHLLKLNGHSPPLASTSLSTSFAQGTKRYSLNGSRDEGARYEREGIVTGPPRPAVEVEEAVEDVERGRRSS
jgi:hypothetical protein